MKKFLFATALVAVLSLATSASAYACVIKVTHDCSSTTVSFHDFPPDSRTRVIINSRLFEFSGSQARFTVGNSETLSVEAHTHLSNGRVRVNARSMTLDRSACVTEPPVTPPAKPPVVPSVHLGKFFGDPMIYVHVGQGRYLIRGADQCSSKLAGPKTVLCHVLPGHSVKVYAKGKLLARKVAP